MRTLNAKLSIDYFKANPSNNLHGVKVNGYWFRVTKDTKQGKSVMLSLLCPQGTVNDRESNLVKKSRTTPHK